MSSFLSAVYDRFEDALLAVRKFTQNITHTIRAGAYEPIKPGQLHKDFMATASLPQKFGLTVSRNAIAFAGAAISDVALNVLGMVSVSAVTLGGVVAGALGLGALGWIYHNSKKAAALDISEENMAGQIVHGRREDLYIMHQAQKKIVSLTRSFEEVASARHVREEIGQIIAETNAVRRRIRVENPGDAPGHRNEYDLIVPKVTYEDALPETAAPPVRASGMISGMISDRAFKNLRRHPRPRGHGRAPASASASA